MLVSFAFRPDASIRGPGSVTWDDVKIQMATTGIEYFEIAADYQENLESPPAVVYEGALTISTNNTGPDQGPKDFDKVVRLQRPFLYEPNSGSLLVEWTTNSGSLRKRFARPVMFSFMAHLPW